MIDYDYTPLYYVFPMQVRYFSGGRYKGGIVYHDLLIDGDSGDVLLIEKVIDKAKVNGVDFEHAIIEYSWKEIGDFIMKN